MDECQTEVDECGAAANDRQHQDERDKSHGAPHRKGLIRMVQELLGEGDQLADPGDRMTDGAKHALRIAKKRFDGDGKRGERQGRGKIHA
jgi:hypothetical protein